MPHSALLTMGYHPVPYPDLEIRGGIIQKYIFGPSGLSLGEAPPLDPPLPPERFFYPGPFSRTKEKKLINMFQYKIYVKNCSSKSHRQRSLLTVLGNKTRSERHASLVSVRLGVLGSFTGPVLN